MKKLSEMKPSDALRLLQHIQPPLHPLSEDKERDGWTSTSPDALVGRFRNDEWGLGLVILDGDVFYVHLANKDGRPSPMGEWREFFLAVKV